MQSRVAFFQMITEERFLSITLSIFLSAQKGVKEKTT